MNPSGADRSLRSLRHYQTRKYNLGKTVHPPNDSLRTVGGKKIPPPPKKKKKKQKSPNAKPRSGRIKGKNDKEDQKKKTPTGDAYLSRAIEIGRRRGSNCRRRYIRRRQGPSSHRTSFHSGPAISTHTHKKKRNKVKKNSQKRPQKKKNKNNNKERPQRRRGKGSS